MKRIFLIISVTAGLIACNGGENNNSGITANTELTDSLKNEAIRDSSNFTTIAWVDSTFQNVGDVKLGQTVEIPFTVKNTGDKPLIISSVQPGCGCTVAGKPEKPILPGNEDKIIATFNSTGQSEGGHTKTLTVTANSTPSTTHTLSFQVNVVN